MHAKLYLLVLFLANAVLSAVPEWYDADLGNRYPGYIIGKGFAKLSGENKAEALLIARKEALNDTASGIFCRVSGETISHASETGTGADARVEAYFLEQALQNKLALYKAIQSDNALKVELRTDKISDGPIIYIFGEKPKIFIRSNKSCYIRLIYIFSDNTKTLLKNNYFIASDQVNQWIRIPFDAVICEPTGVEQLILQASTEKQPPVNYHRQDLGDGFYIDIIREKISKPVGVTRGLKLKKTRKRN